MSAVERPDAEPLPVEDQLELAQAENVDLRRQLAQAEARYVGTLRQIITRLDGEDVS